MNLTLQPVNVQSLKGACVARLEELILSGELSPGEKLPPERALAVRLGVSRPVLHEALVDLASKGLVTIAPRHGVTINDFRKSGSVAILSSLLAYSEGRLDPRFVRSMFDMRILIEQETARLAAVHATDEQVSQLRALLEQEDQLDPGNVPAIIALDFEFHLIISIASGNQVYPLILNSFKNIYIHFTRQFFAHYPKSAILVEVFNYHRRLVDAIAHHQPAETAAIMFEMLTHGEQALFAALLPQSGESHDANGM